MAARIYSEFAQRKLPKGGTAPSLSKGSHASVNVKQGCYKQGLPGKASNNFSKMRGAKKVNGYAHSQGI